MVNVIFSDRLLFGLNTVNMAILIFRSLKIIANSDESSLQRFKYELRRMDITPVQPSITHLSSVKIFVVKLMGDSS